MGAAILVVHPGRRVDFAFDQDALTFLDVLRTRLGQLATGGDARPLDALDELARSIGVAVVDRDGEVAHGYAVRRHLQLGVATDAADNQGELVHQLLP